jgi:lipoate-protein ligase A
MAIDEALLSCFNPETSAPVLRLYGWAPPALSLGRFQDAHAVLDLDRCRTDSIPVVRRMTGGGVIYHSDELTYSLVCAPRHLPSCSTVKESFRLLTGFLIAFYGSLGIHARYAVDAASDTERLGERVPFCFAGRESFDIIADGRKIGGNAQRRQKNTIFQHGSIPLADRIATGIAYLSEKPRITATSVASLADFGVVAAESGLRSGLATAFSATLGVVMESSVLTPDELRMSVLLESGKYRADSWNLDGETA